jgi:endonuclease III
MDMKYLSRIKLLQKKSIRVDKILVGLYGAKSQTVRTDPTSELILTVLSQNTNDVNRDRAYHTLREHFPNWADVAKAKPGALAKAIKVGGLAAIKSKRIIKILTQIESRSTDYSLSFLNDMPDKEIWDYLISFDGVGPKTASCVMLFALGRKVMPVDTHVHRVGKRLGIIPENYSAEKAHPWFLELELALDMYQFHLNLIQHGRAICRPRNPKCDACPLIRLCLYYQAMSDSSSRQAKGH